VSDAARNVLADFGDCAVCVATGVAIYLIVAILAWGGVDDDD
jgi:hypothetical protein